MPKMKAMKSDIDSLKKFCENLEVKYQLSHENSIDSSRGENPLGS